MDCDAPGPGGVQPQLPHRRSDRGQWVFGVNVGTQIQMQYLPGTALDDHRDLAGAARVLAAVHQVFDDHLRRRTPFVRLRGISWSAMGWTDYDGVRNPSAWKTLQNYMNLEFIRSLFDPVMG